jgi:hypothetical protein
MEITAIQADITTLDKQLGETTIVDQGMLDAPPWCWPDKG